MLFLFINVSFVAKFQQDTRLNVIMSSSNYAECLQTKYENRRDYNVKQMSNFDSCRHYTQKALFQSSDLS